MAFSSDGYELIDFGNINRYPENDVYVYNIDGRVCPNGEGIPFHSALQRFGHGGIYYVLTMKRAEQLGKTFIAPAVLEQHAIAKIHEGMVNREQWFENYN